MKFDQSTEYYKRKLFINKLYEKCDLETSSRSFLIFKESSVTKNLRKSECRFGQILIVLLLHIQYKQLDLKLSFCV